jgi:uncharacterized cysteine cluster protein YcgN (CxxCxxCC family)
MTPKIACPKCGAVEDYVMMGDIQVSFPAYRTHNISKKFIATSKFKIWGANWNSFDHICRNCGYVHISLNEKKLKEQVEKEKIFKKICNDLFELNSENTQDYKNLIIKIKECFNELYGQ